MTGKSENKNSANNSIAHNGEKIKSFDTLKSNFETAYASGTDYAAALYDLATAVAYSVIGKCIDPQKGNTRNTDHASDKGYNPAMLALRSGIAADTELLRKTAYAAEHATKTAYKEDGEPITVIADKDTNAALYDLVGETLSDGFDLVQTAALAIMQQAADHASGANWLETPYTVRKLKKKVYIKLADSAAYCEDETTPIQEVYRAVRREVQNSRAIQTDPRNGYTYIEDYTADGLDTIYYRMGKYIDIGGYDGNGLYTAGIHAAATYDNILESLNLTARQATVLQLRTQGHGYKAIATYLGVTSSAVNGIVDGIRKKAVAIGFMPDGYEVKKPEQKPDTAPKAKAPKAPAPHATITVIQIDTNGNEVARYDTMTAASKATGIDRHRIYDAIKGIKQKTAGGYIWHIEKADE